MAADCKSAAPWSYGGSNPPLCTRFGRRGFPAFATDHRSDEDLSPGTSVSREDGVRADVRLGMREEQPGTRTGSDLERRYPIALLLYGVLAVLCWFTVGEGTIVLFGKPVELRLIPILILATFALRTMLVRQADKIRHDGE